MSGGTTKRIYYADDGSHYALRMPDWQYFITNHAGTISGTATGVATTEPPLKGSGLRPRKRYLRFTGNGREIAIHVLDPASSIWAHGALGLGAEIPTFNAAAPVADNGTVAGKTGEKQRAT